MLTILLSLQLLAEESSSTATRTPLVADTAVVLAEPDLVSALGTLGTPDKVALLTANKPQENALAKVLGESHGYRYLRAGSASEVRGSLREVGLSCGVFLARSGESWRATQIGQCETVAAATPSEPATSAQ